MKKFIKHTLALAAVFVSLSVQAQKKELGNDQYFKGNFKGITQSLPAVSRWLDDSRLLLRRDGKNYVIDRTQAGKNHGLPESG
jgi:hypothetical protein